MKRWLLRIAVFICLLHCLATGSWWVWREFYSAEEFREAMANGEFARAESLKRWGADTESWLWEDSLSQMVEVIEKKDGERLKRLIGFWADVHSRYFPNSLRVVKNCWKTLLHVAAWYGPDVIRILLESGLDANALDSYDNTPLHKAAETKNPENVLFLIQNGADVHSTNKRRQSPLHEAASSLWVDPEDPTPPPEESVEIARILIAAGADPNLKDLNNKSPIESYPGLSEIIEKMNDDKDAREKLKSSEPDTGTEP